MDTPNKGPKVISLRLRRRQQLGEEGFSGDPVAHLANQVTRLFGDQQAEAVKQPDKLDAIEFACYQLLAIEFATNALLAVLEHSLGPTALNSVLVDVEHRRPQYKVVWPEDEHVKTYMDHMPKDSPKAEVLEFKPKETDDAGKRDA